MKRFHLFLAIIPLLCSGCYPTRIVTVSPASGSVHTYSTTVTLPKAHTTTTTTRVVAANEDLSLYLDLQAIGAAFAQSETVQEFEDLLNNSSYMLSNLDLNGDGYVDYLRVLETVEGLNHIFVIQAVIGENLYQDVATLIAEFSQTLDVNVQIVGAPYIYGPNYIVQPVFITRPVIYAHLLKPIYAPWRSPWYWNCYPPHYRHPAPVYMNHYQAYVNTFMYNHRYCHEVRYVEVVHYTEYVKITKYDSCNAYEVQHPEKAFSVRNADTEVRSATATGGSRRVVNALDIRENAKADNTVVTKSSTPRSATTTSSASRSTSSARSTGTTTTARSTATKSSTATRSNNAGTTTTTVRSRVNSSGSANTRTTTVSPTGKTSTVRRGTGSGRK